MASELGLWAFLWGKEAAEDLAGPPDRLPSQGEAPGLPGRGQGSTPLGPARLLGDPGGFCEAVGRSLGREGWAVPLPRAVSRTLGCTAGRGVAGARFLRWKR